MRLRVGGLVVVVLFALLGLRLWTLQVLHAPAAVEAVTANQVRVVSVAPTRGLILDRNGTPLVDNSTLEQVTLSRIAAEQHPEVVGRLAALLGETTAQVDAVLADPRNSLYKPVPVASDAPQADILYIDEHKSEFPGVATASTTERHYPLSEPPGPAASGYPAAQVLGYIRGINAAELKAEAGHGYQPNDSYGQDGLEYQYQSELRGTPGRQELEVDALGRVVGTLKSVPPTAGDNVVTNIDAGLQEFADNALATQVVNLRASYDPNCNNKAGCHPAATGGAAVVMDPQTGAVYAMSSFPTYNPSMWSGTVTQAQLAALNSSAGNYPLVDRSIAGQYTPGSTFKLVTATAALDLGLPAARQTYDDTGTFTVPGCTGGTCQFHNADSEALGPIDLTTAITASDDAFFYNLGAQFYLQRGSPAFGETPIQNQAAQYGLDTQTGIDLPNESHGRTDSAAERQKLHAENPTAFPNTTWYAGDNVELAFGQGATVITPVEQAVAYATFANGGTRYAPQVAAAIVDASGDVVRRFGPRVTGHVSLPPSTYEPMLKGFEGVIQSPAGTAAGTFAGSAFPAGQLAGKTGTADTEIGKEPTGWFVAWGPVSDPRYVVVCVIDQAGYGASTAAPVVRQIFDYLAAHPVGPPAPPVGPSAAPAGPKPAPPATVPTSPATSPAP